MAINLTINETRQNENDQTVFFTITKGSVLFAFHADVPLGLEGMDLLNYLKARKERFLLMVLGKMYRGADYSEFKTEENTDLEAIQEWITNGCINPGGMVIEKQEWKSTHPEFITEAEIDGITKLSELKPIIKKIIRRMK